jgi:L-threonylcarbamoyladenylate synthase
MRCRVTHNPEEAAGALRAGKLVALPTETVYGLGGNAFDPRAVAQIFAVKERPTFDPLIVHVASVAQVPMVAAEFPPLARRLAENFWPGPLTLVLPKTEKVPALVTSGLPTVAVRIPDHPLMQRVLELAEVPIAAPSANRFGRLSPTCVEHVLDQLGERIDLVLDGGPCRIGVESTILQIQGDSAVQLRPGGISIESLSEVIGPVKLPERSSTPYPMVPGQLPSHYAPRTPLRIVSALPKEAPGPGIGVLLWIPQELSGYERVETLSPSGDLNEAAAGFFQALHRLDQGNLQLIIAQYFPEQGLGRALNDRLRRAETQHSS